MCVFAQRNTEQSACVRIFLENPVSTDDLCSVVYFVAICLVSVTLTVVFLEI